MTIQSIRQGSNHFQTCFFLTTPKICAKAQYEIPEVPEGPFAGRQPGQRGEDLLQDQLTMLLIT